jgi:futalosine hydrolase
MSILVVSATQAEVDSILYTKGVDVLITGIGSAITCYKTLERLHRKNYELLIQVGFCGTFNHDIQPGEVVAVKEDCFGDLGMEQNKVFIPLAESTYFDPDEFPFRHGRLVNDYKVPGAEDLIHVRAATVNKITDDVHQKEQLIHHFQPDIETMEGAGFQYVAIKANVPFIQVRAVTNHVGIRDRSLWRFAEALTNLSTATKKIIDRNSR